MGSRTRGRLNELIKKRNEMGKRERKGGKEEGRMKGKIKVEDKGGMKRRDTEDSGSVWAWPVLHNTDIHLKRWKHKDNYIASIIVL
jgi:hypothetical protein